jgi:hypothetical protein
MSPEDQKLQEAMIAARQAVAGAAYSARDPALAKADDTIRELWIALQAARAEGRGKGVGNADTPITDAEVEAGARAVAEIIHPMPVRSKDAVNIESYCQRLVRACLEAAAAVRGETK